MYGSAETDGGKGKYQRVPEASIDSGASFRRRKNSTNTKENKNQKKQKKNKRIKELQKKRPVFHNVFDDQNGSQKTKKSKTNASSSNSKSSSSSEVLPSFVDEQGKHDKERGHSFVFEMLSPHSNKWQALPFRRLITLIILVDLVFFVLSTDEESSKVLSSGVYYAEEGIVSTIFLVEYVARVYTITEARKYRNRPIVGRLQYMVTFEAIIDLVAALPFFLELPTGWRLPNLTYLRFTRIFRILKSAGAIKALDAVYRVVYFNRQILWVACLLCILLVFVTSILLYYCRPGENNSQNELFDSLMDTMFMSTLMLTGGGGPDTNDLPWYTRAVVLLTQILSVPMFAIPASMLTWGFEAEAERMAKEARKRVLHRRKQSGDSDDYRSENGGDTTDEEYFRLIAGEEEEAEQQDPDETPWMKEQRRKFDLADVDMDGALTLKEYMKIQQAKTSNEDNSSPGDPQQVSKRLKELESKLDRVMTLLEKRDSSQGKGQV